MTDAHVSQPLEHMQSGSHVCIIVTFTIVTAVRVCLSLGSAREMTATRVCLSLCQSDSCVCMFVTRVGARSDSDTCMLACHSVRVTAVRVNVSLGSARRVTAMRV